MPPKPKTGKKQDELESLEGLPKAFPFFVQLQYNVNSPAAKAFLREQLEDPDQPLPAGQFVSRDEILECGRTKGIVGEDEDPAGISPEKVAKSAAAKVYELLAAAMKDKAIRFKEVKDQAIADYMAAQKPKADDESKDKAKTKPKAGKKEGQPEIDIPIKYPDEDIDLFVFLKGFPANEAEAIAFAQERYALNAVVSIREGKAVEPPKTEEKPPEEPAHKKKEEKKAAGKKKESKKAEKEKEKAKAKGKEEPEAPHEPTEEEKHLAEEEKKQHAGEIKANAAMVEMLQQLAKKSERDSALRHMIRIEVEYNPVTGDDPLPGAEMFKTKLMTALKDVGRSFVSFDKLVQAAKLRPLCKVPAEVQPVRPAEEKLEVKEETKTEEKKEEPSAKKESAKKEDKKKPTKEAKKEEKKAAKKDAAGKHAEKQEEQQHVPKPYDTDAVYPYHRPVHPYSLDDIPSAWQLFFYTKNMEKVRGEARTVGAVLLCLLQQIGLSRQELPPPKPTEVQDLLQMFAEKKEALFRDQMLSEANQGGEGNTKVEVGEQVKSPYHVIYDEHDFARAQYHGENVFNESVLMSEFELGVLSGLLYPGKERYMMPATPAKVEAARGALRCEMHPFSTLPVGEFERALLLREFEKMFGKKNPQGQWDFGDRKYEEKFGKEALGEVFSRAMLFSPDVLTSYYVLDDALLVGVYYQSPPGRILYKQWKGRFQHLPDFPNYLHVFPKELAASQSLLDLDDGKVGPVEEKTKFMYPSDSSVIRVSRRKIGNEDFPSVQVLKDSYTFGLRNDPDGKSQCEFWLDFDDGAKLKVGMQNASGAVATLTFKCGLIVKFTGTGDVVQLRAEDVCRDRTEPSPADPSLRREVPASELHRVITGKGTVLRYLENGTIDVLMANGSTSEYKDGLWVGVNSRGKRRGRKAHEFEMEPISCAEKTDPETLAKVSLRQDGVVSVKYKDGQLLVRHKDETAMLTSPNGLSTTVEKEGYAPVRVRIDPMKVRTGAVISRGGTDALLGMDDIMMRSNDGRVAETFLPDGTIVQTYKERQQLDGLDKFSMNIIHLIRRPDGGVIKVKEDGEVVIMTPEQRVALNEKGQKRETGKDIDYFYELFTVPTERKSGVYTVRCNLGKMFTIDDEGNKFYVYANGVTRERIAVSFNLDNLQEEEPAQPPSPRFQGPVYIDDQSKFLPAPKYRSALIS